MVDSTAIAALASWKLDPRVITVLLVTAFVYVRGWMRGRRLVRSERDYGHLAAFVGGLAVLFVATESPLDAFDNLFLFAHMTQHMLLMMIAPPLLLLGHPVVPLLRGLPKRFVREALGPFLTWPALRRCARFLVAPPVALSAFAVSMILWHVPPIYELALRSRAWHEAQHACFFWTGILFWWPIVQPGPGKSRWPQWIAIPYLLFADILNTALSALFVFSGKLIYPTYALVRANGMSAQDDQTLAGVIMWVPGSLIYILPAIVFSMRLLSGTQIQGRPSVTRRVRRRHVQLSWHRVNLPLIRRAAQVVMLLLAIAVMADGFFGPRITSLNLAGTLPWIHWRALSLMALLAVGNLFCMACPFTFVRDVGRRVLPASWRWPRFLRTKWLAATLFLAYLWTYEAFSLWDSARATAWIIVGYFLTALIIDGLFRGASFCKYVCPIGQFHFVSSLISPREMRVRNPAVCKSCRTHDCIRGNERARGCELYLFQPKKLGNLDCTLCMDCVKACPHDNVGLVRVLPASTIIADPYRSSIGRLSKRTDLAVLTLFIVFGAFVNAAGMVSPVMRWEHGWHALLGPYMMPAVVAGFIFAGVVLVPAVSVLFCACLNRVTGSALKVADTARRFVFTLVPVGVAMWAAHLLYHFVTGWNAPWTAVQRIISSSFAVTAPFVPAWLTSAQILLLNAGLLLTLYVAWRVARQYAPRLRTAAAILMPWAALACALYGAGIWILFQPMQMRGMLH
jgi:cytochrome c oxidase assembly factor CtaG/polyferredoxin